METKERDILLMICDISGYTNYMMSNKISLFHSQLVIIELMKEIIDRIELPMQVAKLEGDAIFCYVLKDEDKYQWSMTKSEIGDRILSFFELFSNKLKDFQKNDPCDCNFCQNIDKLKLKIIIHSGSALFFSIDTFQELGGIDVIIAHRLLKNSINSDEYILMTESAYNDLGFSQVLPVVEHEEQYDVLETIKSYIYFPEESNRELFLSSAASLL